MTDLEHGDAVQVMSDCLLMLNASFLRKQSWFGETLIFVFILLFLENSGSKCWIFPNFVTCKWTTLLQFFLPFFLENKIMTNAD